MNYRIRKTKLLVENHSCFNSLINRLRKNYDSLHDEIVKIDDKKLFKNFVSYS